MVKVAFPPGLYYIPSDICLCAASSICGIEHYLNDMHFQQHSPLCAAAGEATEFPVN